jgi:hypothetical protein
MSTFRSALQEAARSSPISKNIAALVSVNVLTSQTGILSVNAARYSLVADIRISSSDSEKSIAQSVAIPGGAASCEMAGPNAVDPANLCQEPPCPCNEAKPGGIPTGIPGRVSGQTPMSGVRVGEGIQRESRGFPQELRRVGRLQLAT